MKWEDIRRAFPNQWVVLEATKAYTDVNSKRVLEEVVALHKFPNSIEAMNLYRALHKADPKRELYVLHTNRKEPNIIEKR